MLKIEINPENSKQMFIDAIRESFKRAFDINAYNWTFERQTGKEKADIIVLKNESDASIAGSGITYRQLLLPDNQLIDIAIMTYSWTLPVARGMGCFSKIIELSKEIPLEKNIRCLTAFVTEDNASYRRLKNAGAYLVPAYYLFSSRDTNITEQTLQISVSKTKKQYELLFEKRAAMFSKDISFHYNNQTDFESQFIARNTKTEVLEIGDNFAVIEETPDLIKVLLITYESRESFTECIKSLLQWSKSEKSKRILYYTTDLAICDVCRSLDFDVLNGYFSLLFLDNAPLPPQLLGDDGKMENRLSIQYGDKM